MKRLAAILPLLVLVMAAVLITAVGCPGGDETRTQTPADAFRASQQRVEERDFKSEWNWMTKRLQMSFAQENDKLKAAIRADPGNRKVFDDMLMELYEVDAAQFIEADPRDLHARFLAIHRQEMLRYEVLGEARIEGEAAYLPVKLLKDDQPAEFRYVLEDGRWLLDEGIRGRD